MQKRAQTIFDFNNKLDELKQLKDFLSEFVAR
jgi:hypothetical protein